MPVVAWPRVSSLAGSSWQLLWQDKKLIVFPVISSICCLLVIVAFCVPFVADPQQMIPANRMPYAGMPDANDRADLIAYLSKAFR